MLNSGSQLAFQQGTFYIASHFLLSNLLCKSVVAPGSDLKTYLFLDAVADPDTHLGGHIKRTGDLERSAEHWKQILALKGQLIYRFIHFPISSISYSTFFFLNVRPLFYFEILFLNFFLSSLSFNFHRGLNLSQELFSRMNCDV